MNLHGIDLNLLVAFDALMAERSVTRAGIRIGRTQPAMSAALSRLRTLLRDELFVRGPDGLQPTPRAFDLVVPISQALGQIQETLDFTQAFQAETFDGSFTVGMSDLPMEALLPPLMERIAALAPGAALHVKLIIAREEAMELLDSGEIDAAVSVSFPASTRLRSEPVYEERFVCVLRKTHPAANRRLTMNAFLALTHVLVSPESERRGFVDVELGKTGKKRKVGLTVPQLHAVPRLIAGSDMIATVLEGTIKASRYGDLLAVKAPPLALPSIPFFLHWHKRNANHPAQRWLREQITASAAKWGCNLG